MNTALQAEASNISRHAKSGWVRARDRSKLLQSLAGESKHKERGNVAIRISITSETDKGTARLAQSAERKALNLVVVGSSPTVGVFPQLAKFGFPAACARKHRQSVAPQ